MWLASFAFSFPNDWTAKLSRCNDQACLRDDQRSFCCCFNECGHLELVNIAWKHPSRQEVEMWFGCKIIWKITLRRVDAVSGVIFFVVVYPCRIPWLLPLLGHLPSCLWGHLLVQSSAGKKKQAVLSEWPSFATEVTWWVFVAAVNARKTSPSAVTATGDSAKNSKRTKCSNTKGRN